MVDILQENRLFADSSNKKPFECHSLRERENKRLNIHWRNFEGGIRFVFNDNSNIPAVVHCFADYIENKKYYIDIETLEMFVAWKFLSVQFDKVPCIYFLQAEQLKLIKIGYSNNFIHRIKILETGSPDHLVLLKVVKGSRKEEQALHRHFKSDRVKGEWFNPSQSLLSFIEGLG